MDIDGDFNELLTHPESLEPEQLATPYVFHLYDV